MSADRPRCYACRTAVRGSMAVHLSTARHARTVAAPVMRASRLALRVRDGARPSWMVAQRRDADEPTADGFASIDAWRDWTSLLRTAPEVTL